MSDKQEQAIKSPEKTATLEDLVKAGGKGQRQKWGTRARTELLIACYLQGKQARKDKAK